VGVDSVAGGRGDAAGEDVEGGGGGFGVCVG